MTGTEDGGPATLSVDQAPIVVGGSSPTDTSAAQSGIFCVRTAAMMCYLCHFASSCLIHNYLLSQRLMLCFSQA